MNSARILFGILTLMVVAAIVIYKPFDNFAYSDGEYCFARVQEATESEPYMVEEYIDLVLSGGTVIGTQSGVQSGPDMTNGYQGDLSGTRSGDDISATFTYEIEGSIGKELEMFSFSGENLVKHRYALKEDGDVLVPDLTTTPKEIIYTPEACG